MKNYVKKYFYHLIVLILMIMIFTLPEEYFDYILLLLSLTMTIFGVKLFFQKGYVERFRETEEDVDHANERFGGVRGLSFGLVMSGIAIYWLLN